jgi:hypothetical protein
MRQPLPIRVRGPLDPEPAGGAANRKVSRAKIDVPRGQLDYLPYPDSVRLERQHLHVTGPPSRRNGARKAPKRKAGSQHSLGSGLRSRGPQTIERRERREGLFRRGRGFDPLNRGPGHPAN